MSLTSVARTGAVRTGPFSYMAATVERSLYRNGKVLLHRDCHGNDTGITGLNLEERQMPVHDARCLAESQRRTLHTNGFELLERPVSTPDIDFLNHDQVVRRYYPHCEDIVRDASGAHLVAAFDHNIRSASGHESERRIEGGQLVLPPVHVVHADYTLTSGPQRLRDLANPPAVNDTYRTRLSGGESLLDKADVARTLETGRFAIVNLWRNIAAEPVAVHPLALCDATGVHPDDLVVFEIHYADRIGENYFARHSDDHRWYFYPALTRDEVLLIKQWDSAGGLARSNGERSDAMSPDPPSTFSFHSAFEDPATAPGAPDRWSIEVRCVALYDWPAYFTKPLVELPPSD